MFSLRSGFVMSFRPLFVSFSSRRNHPRLYCHWLLSRVPNRRMPERLVDEQQAAEIGGERLDADADGVEVVVVGHVAQVLVDEELLHGDDAVVARRALARIDAQHAHLVDLRAVEVDHRHEAKFVVGRPERRVALDQRQAQDQVLVEQRLPVAAELVVGLRILRGLRADRRGNLPQFEQRVGHRADVDEPVVAEHRAVALQRVRVVRVVPALVDEAQLIHQPPAIGHRNRLARQQRFGRRHLRRVDRRNQRFERLPHRLPLHDAIVGGASASPAAAARARSHGDLGAARNPRAWHRRRSWARSCRTHSRPSPRDRRTARSGTTRRAAPAPRPVRPPAIAR